FPGELGGAFEKAVREIDGVCFTTDVQGGAAQADCSAALSRQLAQERRVGSAELQGEAGIFEVEAAVGIGGVHGGQGGDAKPRARGAGGPRRRRGPPEKVRLFCPSGSDFRMAFTMSFGRWLGFGVALGLIAALLPIMQGEVELD